MAAWFGKHALILNLGVVLAFAAFLLLGSLSRAANPAGTAEKPGTGEKDAAIATTWQGSVKMFAAALAVGSTALATGLTQSRIGSAGVGALAENPKLFGNILIFLVIPETMVILGFVIAALMMF